MKKIIFLFVMIVSISVKGIFGAGFVIFANEISDPLNYIPQPFDVESYNAEIDLTAYPTTYIEGKCEINLFWKESPRDKKFFFHLRDLNVDSVFYQNQMVEAIAVGQPEDATYHYEIDVPDESNNFAKVTVYYHGNMSVELNQSTMKWGGVQMKDNILFSMGVGFFNNYVSSTQHWLPCYDLPSDKAKFKCNFKIPIETFIASNGLLTNTVNNDDGTKICTWEHDNDCATYNYTFALGTYKEMNFGTSELPMVVYCQPEDTTNAKSVFKLLPRMVETYSKRFGDYPFEKVGYVLTPIGSMEHETMISFAYKLVRFSTDTVNETGAHELAHMWFGDFVTPYDFRDAWLNEGFATFCEALWYEDLYGFEDYLNHIDFMRGFYISNNGGSKYEGVFPLYDFPRTAPSSNYPMTIYYKGGVVVSMLRFELGDTLFYKAIKKYLNDKQYGNVTTEDLKIICEDISGKNLDWFFNQWVYGRGWPQLAINFVPQAENYKLKITQVQPFDTWEVFQNVPVEIGFQDPDGNYTYQIFNLTETEQVFDVALDYKCSRITINKGINLRALLEIKTITYTDIEEETMSGLNIYPNPSDSQTVIVFNSGDGIATIDIYDSEGKKVLNTNLTTRKGSNQFLINTNAFSSGNYFIVIESELGMIREKFSITH